MAAMGREQLELTYCIFLFLPLLFPLVLLLKLKTKRDRGGDGTGHGRKLPPGPWRLPVVGSLHHLVGAPRLAHRAMAELARRHGAPDLMYLRLGELPVVVVSSAGAAREIMRTHDAAFASRPWIPSMRRIAEAGDVGVALARHGALWRQLRKICVMDLLSAARVQSFRRVREDEAGRLAAAASSHSGEAVNIRELVGAFTNDSAALTMLGDRFRRREREEFLRAINEGTKAFPGLGVADLFPSSRLARFAGRSMRRVEAVHRSLSELMDVVISQHEERRAAAAGDAVEENLVAVLLRVQKEGDLEVPLTTGVVKCVIIDVFTGGSDTTLQTLQWAMSELIRNPHAMHKAQAEVRNKLCGLQKVTEDYLPNLMYLKLVIKETMRLHPPLPLLLPRECMEDCKVMGYDVPKGTMVLVNAWAIGRDPSYWDDANSFKPERFEDGRIDFKGTDFEFIPFGAGRRMCPGMRFALVSIELALATLLYHFDWELPSMMASIELDMTEEMGMTVYKKNDLYLCPKVCVPLHVTT